MNSDEFVEAIHATVYKSVIRAMLQTLASPPGRRPRRHDVELNSWYNGLSDEDKRQVAGVVREAAGQAIFGMLAVLDGVQTIDDDHTDLYLRTGDGTLINDPDRNELHAIFRAIVDHELGYADESGGPLPLSAESGP
jgi:hypothetical protein